MQLVPKHYGDFIAEPLTIVHIFQFTDYCSTHRNFKKSTLKFHCANIEEVFKDSMPRLYNHIIEKCDSFDLTKDFCYEVYYHGKGVFAGWLKLDSNLCRKAVK